MSERSDALRTIFEHRTIRKYKSDKIPRSDLRNILMAGIRAPSSTNLQTYSMIQVEDRAKREKIAEISGDQQQIIEASEFIVFLADIRRHIVIGESKGIDMAEPNLYALYVSIIDATIAAQNIVIAAESLGYGTCYIGSIQNDPRRVAETLGLPKYVYPIFGLCIGIPDESPDLKPRIGIEELYYTDNYPSDDYVVKRALDCLRSNGFIGSYIRRITRYYRKGGRLEHRNKLMLDLLRRQGFRV